MRNGRWAGGLCLPPGALKILGTVLIAAGSILVIVFVPIRYWMALLGTLLLLAGIALKMCL